MRSANKRYWLAGIGLLGLIAAIPAISQDAPESILPPGFGDPVEDTKKPNEPTTTRPADLVPDVALKPPSSSPSGSSQSKSSAPISDELAALEDKDAEGDESLVQQAPQDLPAQARRSLDRIGVLESGDGDMGPAAFGMADGRYLAYLMRTTKAPIASRWASIALRRALLSQVDTPANISGPDWVADRAWLLLRMGEADAALMLVQAVDPDRYTPRLQDVALQASLAAADPSSSCAFSEWVDRKRKEQAWPMVRAICAAFSGESAQASAQIDAARDRGKARGVDGLLAEKVVGAGSNGRRSIKIEWEGVEQLTAWRYGLATATAVDVPDRLFATVGPHVRGWHARAAMLPLERRSRSADIAASLGVFSGNALVDFYGQWAEATDPAQAENKPFQLLRVAYAGGSPQDRITAMKLLWQNAGDDQRVQYGRQILTARAAALIKPDAALGDNADGLIRSMLSAGFDVQAARWAQIAMDAGGEAERQSWGLLAVGAPARVVPWTRGELQSYISNAGSETNRGALMFAGFAGLARLQADDISDLASDLAIPIGRQTAWTRALDRAVNAREQATVVLLCAVGLQGQDFSKVSASNFYHAVSALRKVGLGAEARMLAAEAISRS
jgi:hypothetical protein